MRLTRNTLSAFHPGTAIPNAIARFLPTFKGTLLDVGCGNMPYKGMIMGNSNVSTYLGLDLEKNPIYKTKPDLTWDGTTIPCEDCSVDVILATELFEHVPDLNSVLSECHRVLKEDGILFFLQFLFYGHCTMFLMTCTDIHLIP
jgi:2-polyprenyl-3-methyl-5-hydroxy-6-metoxy-1,4-benzoquinol methylase